MDRTLLKMMDFRRERKSFKADIDLQHPLVAASAALARKPASRVRTGNLVSLLLTQAARIRRRSQPKRIVRLQVLTPQGSSAVRIHL